jgi:Protein of unknown function (DUF2510)
MTGTAPPGWHPDPSGMHEFRYWDGTRWTEHVSDNGIASADGGTATTGGSDKSSLAGQVGGDASRQVLLDAQLQIGLRSKRLFADNQGISWGGDSVPYSRITAMAWWITKVVAGPAHNFDYRIILWEGKEQTKITFTGRGDHVRDAYTKAVGILFQHAGARICNDVLSSLEAGQTVEIARLTLTPSGIASKKQFLLWNTPLTFTTMIDWPGVSVADGSRPKAKAIEVGFMQPNGPLVLPLVEACQRRYGSG